MDYIEPCLQKIVLSPRLKAAFSLSQEIVFIDFLNNYGDWIRQNISFSFFKAIDSKILNLMDKEQFKLEMEGELVCVVSSRISGYHTMKIVFEEINYDGYINQ